MHLQSGSTAILIQVNGLYFSQVLLNSHDWLYFASYFGPFNGTTVNLGTLSVLNIEPKLIFWAFLILPLIGTFPSLTVAPENDSKKDANYSKSCEFDRTCEK